MRDLVLMLEKATDVYRSLFMWYMWRVEDVNLEAIEGT